MKTLQEIADFFQKPVAQDENGDIYVYIDTPKLSSHTWRGVAICFMTKLMEIETIPDWTQSLRLPKTDATKLKVDDKIMVRNWPNDSWSPRFFACLREDGSIYCFDSGRPKWTAGKELIEWKEWRLPTEEELKGGS